ncbi:MAG: hypothetical protein DWQ07_12935 [Chloroflexi bacterium]|nr:MAG: hypothetical protein DWQ07_12935 [Chloroflexota bacterium]MBL1196945.1 hypothetical protein [Chloroflexota bacterium]NOH14241.1 hypothetical protein [Chloroflexota bacterium]
MKKYKTDKLTISTLSDEKLFFNVRGGGSNWQAKFVEKSVSLYLSFWLAIVLLIAGARYAAKIILQIESPELPAGFLIFDLLMSIWTVSVFLVQPLRSEMIKAFKELFLANN